MPLHHYLPASFLARFSQDLTTEPLRNRLLSIGDKKTQKCFEDLAGNVGCINNLYTLLDSPSDPEIIDKTWEDYEKKLPASIEKLLHEQVDTETWLRILIPFVSCMLVRGPDFIEKFNERFTFISPEAREQYLSSDNANRARLLELQRLIGFVSTAKWIVVSTDKMLITNDLGYSPFYNPITSEIGMAIPLGFNNVLIIIPTLEDHPILREEDNKWLPIIQYSNLLDISNADKSDINFAIAKTANRFIYGANNDLIKKYINRADSSPQSLESTQFGFPGGDRARAYEFTWHRLVSAIKKPPSDKKGWDFSLNIPLIASGWYPPPIFPINLIEFPPALKKVNNTICSNYYDPEIYFTISRINELEGVGKYDEAISEATNALTTKISKSLKARIFSTRGLIYGEKGNYRKAMIDFENAIKLNPSNAFIYVDFGYTLLNANSAPRAYKILSKAIKLDPQNGIAYLNRCIALRVIGHQKDALADSIYAIRLLPDGEKKERAVLIKGEILKQLRLDDQVDY